MRDPRNVLWVQLAVILALWFLAMSLDYIWR